MLWRNMEYDLSNIIDPTIEQWSAHDSFEPSTKLIDGPTVNYWFSAEELKFFHGHELPLEDSCCIVKEITPTSADDISSPSQSENFWEPIKVDFDYSELVLAEEFWKTQYSFASKGLQDSALIAANEFLKTQEALLLSPELPTARDASLPASKRWKFENTPELSSATQEAGTALAKDENLIKINEQLRREKSQWIICHQWMSNQLAQKDRQLEVVDEMISHNIDLEAANEQLNKKWNQATNQLKIAHNVELENYELISTNSKLTCEKQQLISNFTGKEEKLISSNSNLHALAVTLGKTAERYYEENCKLHNIIDILRKRDIRHSSPPSSSQSMNSDFGFESTTRSRGSMRTRSSKRKACMESKLVPPASAGMVYVYS